MRPTVKVPVQKIIWTGLLVGTLDMLAALLDYYINTGKGPAGVLTYIASGVFGRAAMSGGVTMQLTGLVFHYIIALLFTLFFFWLYAKTTWMAHHRILTGLVYGLFIWITMNLVVVRLSNAPHAPLRAMQPWKAFKAYLILVGMIGIPLSFIAYGLYKSELKNNSDDAGGASSL